MLFIIQESFSVSLGDLVFARGHCRPTSQKIFVLNIVEQGLLWFNVFFFRLKKGFNICFLVFMTNAVMKASNMRPGRTTSALWTAFLQPSSPSCRSSSSELRSRSRKSRIINLQLFVTTTSKKR